MTKFDCGIGYEVFPGRANAADFVVAGRSGGANEVLYIDGFVENDAKVFDRVGKGYGIIVKLYGAD